jgi:hypothetical protein
VIGVIVDRGPGAQFIPMTEERTCEIAMPTCLYPQLWP